MGEEGVVSRYAETGTPAALLESLPLFAAAASSPLACEADVHLPKMALGEHVLADYIAIRMSLKAQPMALLREDFEPRGYLETAALRHIHRAASSRRSALCSSGKDRHRIRRHLLHSRRRDRYRQHIIWPKIFEKYRRIVLGARLLGVRGQLQSEQGVIHIIARELFDMSGTWPS